MWDNWVKNTNGRDRGNFRKRFPDLYNITLVYNTEQVGPTFGYTPWRVYHYVLSNCRIDAFEVDHAKTCERMSCGNMWGSLLILHKQLQISWLSVYVTGSPHVLGHRHQPFLHGPHRQGVVNRRVPSEPWILQEVVHPPISLSLSFDGLRPV